MCDSKLQVTYLFKWFPFFFNYLCSKFEKYKDNGKAMKLLLQLGF